MAYEKRVLRLLLLNRQKCHQADKDRLFSHSLSRDDKSAIRPRVVRRQVGAELLRHSTARGQSSRRHLAGGRTLAEVRDTSGHANVSITSGYLHVAVDDEAALGNLFRLK
jgi:integrase